jgi:hypothetical protein
MIACSCLVQAVYSVKALKHGGREIIGIFAPDGSEECCGLPVARYDAANPQSVLGQRFTLVATRRHHHATLLGIGAEIPVQHVRKALTAARGEQNDCSGCQC